MSKHDRQVPDYTVQNSNLVVLVGWGWGEHNNYNFLVYISLGAYETQSHMPKVTVLRVFTIVKDGQTRVQQSCGCLWGTQVAALI